MKPLPAVGLASSILQILDFGIKISSKEHKLYQPTEGEIVENAALLQSISDYLFLLCDELDQNDLKKLSAESKKAKLSDVAQKLLELSEQTKEHASALIDSIIQAQAKGSYGDARFQTGRDSLLTVWKKKDIKALKKKLKNVRKEVDTALLLALRQYLEQSAEAGLPVFSDDSTLHLPHDEKWQNQAMDAVHANDWKPKNKKNVEEFAKHTQALIQAEAEARFCEVIFANLHFSALDDRLQSIPVPHEGTLEWLFEGSDRDTLVEGPTSFKEWLADKSGQNLFWVTGNPGAGKSVLMKYLLRNPRTFPILESWSGASPGICAGFFFSNCGIDLQKSSIGLLRTLLFESLQDMLYGPLQQDPGIVQWLFSDRWQQFHSYGGGLYDFTFADIRRSFDLMIADISRKFLFVIDGLDELDGYPEDVLNVLLSASKRDNVKICASSRPSPAYQSAFEKKPSLTVNLETDDDIQAYISHTLQNNEKFAKMQNQDSGEELVSHFVREIAGKADGVFLSASLAIDFLVSDADDMESTKSRLHALPSDLDAILAHIFQYHEQTNLQKASRLFRLVTAHGHPDLLSLSFANDTRVESGLSAHIRPLKDAELTQRVADMMGLLQNQCKNLLSIFEVTPENTNDDDDTAAVKPENLRINYRHRVIKDFITSSSPWTQICEATGGDSLNLDEHWANASLWTLKTLPSQHVLPLWEHTAWCIEHALRLEERNAKVHLTYLSAVAETFDTHLANLNLKSLSSSTSDLPTPAPISFFDVAVWLNLIGYVSIKAKDADRKDIKHALEFHKSITRRLGRGGEAKWIGGRGMRRLEQVYVRTAPELDLLLEYYAKPAMSRAVAPKPFVEVPDWV